jgi:hypothetical protein
MTETSPSLTGLKEPTIYLGAKAHRPKGAGPDLDEMVLVFFDW